MYSSLVQRGIHFLYFFLNLTSSNIAAKRNSIYISRFFHLFWKSILYLIFEDLKIIVEIHFISNPRRFKDFEKIYNSKLNIEYKLNEKNRIERFG